jgi:hypothetical protein
MRVAFVASSRADLGLIRPVLRRAPEPALCALACLGPAAAAAEEDLRDAAGDMPFVRLGAEWAGRLSDGRQTSSAFAGHTRLFSEWLAGAPWDWVFLPGDRFEVFAAAVASHYNNVPSAHLFAGDPASVACCPWARSLGA